MTACFAKKGLVWLPSDEKRMQSLEFLHPHSNEYLFSGEKFRVGATCFNRLQSFGKIKRGEHRVSSHLVDSAGFLIEKSSQSDHAVLNVMLISSLLITSSLVSISK